MLSDIKVPLYNSSGYDKIHELIVSEFAGRITMKIKKDGNVVAYIESDFNDIRKAWEAVKKY